MIPQKRYYTGCFFYMLSTALCNFAPFRRTLHTRLALLPRGRMVKKHAHVASSSQSRFRETAKWMISRRHSLETSGDSFRPIKALCWEAKRGMGNKNGHASRTKKGERTHLYDKRGVLTGDTPHVIITRRTTGAARIDKRTKYMK